MNSSSFVNFLLPCVWVAGLFYYKYLFSKIVSFKALNLRIMLAVVPPQSPSHFSSHHLLQRNLTPKINFTAVVEGFFKNF